MSAVQTLTDDAHEDSGTAVVRQLRGDEVADAERIMRVAFGTFLGFPDPAAFGGDSDVVGSRWRSDPTRAYALDVDGCLAGSNLATNWGSFGFFGPLSVAPAHWGKGLAPLLIERALAAFDAWGCRHAGLYTFAQSAKHHALYEKFGFFPRYLTPLLARTTAQPPLGATSPFTRYSTLPAAAQIEVLAECRALTDAIDEGLDVTCEVAAVQRLGLGDTLLVHDDGGLSAFAVCHYGAGTEAGTGNCYVKFAAARGGVAARTRLDAVLAAAEAHALSVHATVVLVGVNTARCEAYTATKARGYRVQAVGLSMQRPHAEGFNRSGVFILDDWR